MAKSMTPANNGGNGEIEKPNALDRIVREMAFQARVDGDSKENRINTLNAILTAESEEDFWNADDKVSIAGRDLVDVEQQIISFTVKKSDAANEIDSLFRDPETGVGLYLDVTAVRLDTGEEMVWNTSAPGLVGKILGMQHRGMLPCECVIRGTKLAGGKEVLKLKPVPKRAVSGKVA